MGLEVYLLDLFKKNLSFLRRRKGCLFSVTLGAFLVCRPSLEELPHLPGCLQLPCVARGEDAVPAGGPAARLCAILFPFVASSFSLRVGLWANKSPKLTPALPHNCLSVHLNSKGNAEKREDPALSLWSAQPCSPHPCLGLVVLPQKDSLEEKLHW